MNEVLFRRILRFIGGVLLALSPLLCSAQLYKCTENGTSTFQSEPCKGAGKVVHVDAPPSAQSTQEAQDRAASDKQAVSDINTGRQQKNQQAANAAPGADCGKLNKAVEDANVEYMKLSREGALPGVTPAGMRNNQRLATAAQKQLFDAKFNASIYGCDKKTGSTIGGW